MSFLNAEWRKLLLVNYVIEEAVLHRYVPYGTALDYWNGRCYVSLVGFMFNNTRLMGLKIPFHVNFEEINLRFYVKRIENETIKRGVVFIKELVPKYAIAAVANAFYHEHYEALPTRHTWETNEDTINVKYAWKKQKRWHSIEALCNAEAKMIEPGSETEFITEHYWGYTKITDNKSSAYEVKHPKWKVYDVLDYNVDVDFAQTYGDHFSFLNHCTPVSVMLAEGSAISVEGKLSL